MRKVNQLLLLPLVVVPLVATMGACSSDQPDQPGNLKGEEGRAISFAGSYVDNPVSRVTDNANFDYFQVWGFVDVPGSRVFDGANVQKDSAGKWVVDETRYWFTDHKYYFTGIGPKMNAGEMNYTPLITWSHPTNDYPGGGTIMFDPTVNSYQTDLVYSFVANPTIDQPVQMTFNHLLSQVSVAFVNEVTEPMQLWVQNVKINGLQTQSALKTYTLPHKWETIGTALTTPLNLTIPENPNVSRYIKYEARATTNPIYLIPGADDCTITFDVTPYTDGITQLGGPYNHTITIQGTELEIGKSYVYVVTINATNLTSDLKPIEFNVEEVASWGTSQEIDGGASTPTN